MSHYDMYGFDPHGGLIIARKTRNEVFLHNQIMRALDPELAIDSSHTPLADNSYHGGFSRLLWRKSIIDSIHTAVSYCP